MYKGFIFIMFAIVSLMTACQTSKSGIIREGETPSGFPYRVYVDEEGPLPQVGDQIAYRRTVRLNQDSILAPHNRMEVTLPLAEQVSAEAMGEYEILLLMSVGDSCSLLVFGDKVEKYGFKPTDTILFDIYLEAILKTKDEVAADLERSKALESEVGQTTQDLVGQYNSGKLAGKLKKTETGLEYMVIKEGTGTPPEAGKEVEVHYYGMLMDQVMFDNSYRRGDTFKFSVGVGMVIPGWDEGIQLMNPGSEYIFFIPSELGYGAQGSPPTIPANAKLAFHVNMIGYK